MKVNLAFFVAMVAMLLIAHIAVGQYRPTDLYQAGDVLHFIGGGGVSIAMRYAEKDSVSGSMVGWGHSIGSAEYFLEPLGGYVVEDEQGIVTTLHKGKIQHRYFPRHIPNCDTVWTSLSPDSVGFVLKSVSDTLIFGVVDTIAHYDLIFKPDSIIPGGYTRYQHITVGEKFGLVSYSGFIYRGSTCEIYRMLKNATVKGVDYNISDERYEFLPLCIGNEWHYIEYIPTVIRITKDTLIDGETYYKAENFRIWPNPKHSIEWGLPFYYKSTERGVYKRTWDGYEELLVPHKERFGESCAQGWVEGANEVILYGEKRQALYLHSLGCTEANTTVYIDGIGLYSSDMWDGTTFVYAKACGKEYGTPLAIDVPTQLPVSFTLGPNYPNPVSLSSPVTNIPVAATHGGPTQLVLTDMLGREVRRVETGSEQNTVTLNVQGLPPGVYWYAMQQHTSQVFNKLIIVP